ncbi:hypothetical protein SARC_11017, partial [Sphaeroforma arctica JP610]
RVIAGLRPFVADEMAIVGPITQYSNLHVACGQGTTGFKTAMGVAVLTAKHLTGDGLSKCSYDTELLSPKGRVTYAPLYMALCSVVDGFMGRT